MQRIMLLNPKGGSGKTTIATSLAAHLAGEGLATVLIDHDAQGSSSRWLRVRNAALPEIHGIEAFRTQMAVTRSWQMRLPHGTERVVVDTPAGFRPPQLVDLIRQADFILVPVLPSHIDIDAVSGFLDDLRRMPPVHSGSTRVALVANRVRSKTSIELELETFLQRAGYPFVARLRESQRYVRAAERGEGVHEVRTRRGARMDVEQWRPMLAWLEGDASAWVAPLAECADDAELQNPLFSAT